MNRTKDVTTEEGVEEINTELLDAELPGVTIGIVELKVRIEAILTILPSHPTVWTIRILLGELERGIEDSLNCLLAIMSDLRKENRKHNADQTGKPGEVPAGGDVGKDQG